MQSCREARLAANRLEKTRLAVERARAQQQEQSARLALAAFPAGVEKLLGNELDVLHTWCAEQQELEKQAESADQARVQAQEKIAAAHLDGVADEPTLLPTLAERLRRATDLQREADTAAAESRAAQQRQNALDALGRSVDEQRLGKLNAAGLADLAELVQQTEQAHGDWQTAQTLRQWVGELADGENAAAAQQGLSLLHQWLRLPETRRPQGDGALLLAAAMLTALSIVAAFWTHGWLALCVPVGPLFYWLVRRQYARQSPADATRVYLQNEFAKLGVAGPASWEAPAVEEASRQLADLLARASQAQARAQRWPDLQQRTAQAKERYEQLAAKCQQFAVDLGLGPQMQGPALLATTHNLLRWQEAQADCAAKNEALDELLRRQIGQMQQIAGDLLPLGYAAPDPAAAGAAIEDLRHRWDLQRSGLQQRDAAAAQRRSIDQRLDRLAQQQRDLFTSAGLASADEMALRDRLQQRGEYEKARDQLRIAEARVAELSGQLADDADLLTRPLEQLEQMLLDLSQTAAQAEQWTIQATSIQTQIASAKKSSDLETALAQEEQAADALRDQRDADCASAAGWALFCRMRDISHEKHLPEVFRRARDLFARVTQGRYRLQFIEGSPPSFSAIDTSTQIGAPSTSSPAERACSCCCACAWRLSNARSRSLPCRWFWTKPLPTATRSAAAC